jgi:hypothetical protein
MPIDVHLVLTGQEAGWASLDAVEKRKIFALTGNKP